MPTSNAMSNYLEDALIEHIFHASNTYSPVSTIYLGLHTASPTDAGGNETVYTNYVRQAIAFSAASSRNITQNGQVDFPQCGVTGATITHYGLYDAETSGNLLAWGALSSSKAVSEGNTPSVADAEVDVYFSAGTISDYLADTLLDFAFRNQAFSKPSKYIFLATVALTDASTGSTITEPGNAYARHQVTAWTCTNNAAENTSEETFSPNPSGTWGAITAVGLADASSAGNILFYDNSPTGDGQTPTTGDTVKFAAGAFDVTLE